MTIALKSLIESYFKLPQQNLTIRGEITAGLTTFFTMAYIIVVNPMILSSVGMDYGSVFVATCLASAFGSLAMGFIANYPIALAPSMGLNAYFAYVVVQQMGYSWQTALGTVCVAGIIFCLLTFTGIRQWLIYLIPPALKIAISAGIGLFLGVIALKNLDVITFDPGLTFHLPALLHINILLCLGGLVIMYLLGRRRISGAILLGILAATLAGIALGITTINGLISSPPSILPTLLQLHFPTLHDPRLLVVTLIFLFVALFDNTGTLIAVLQQAKLVKPNGPIPNLGKALFADSIATIFGSLLGTSSTGSYIESATGVKAGGRTGLTAITVGFLFLTALILAPLAKAIPNYATAAALLYVAGLMTKTLVDINWREPTENIPALITTLAIPLTFSIADGIGLGLASYFMIKGFKRLMKCCAPKCKAD